MNFIKDFPTKYACAINQIKTRGFMPSRTIGRGITYDGSFYQIAKSVKLGGAVCPFTMMLEGKYIRSSINLDITEMFGDGLPMFSESVFMAPFLYGYNSDNSYSDYNYDLMAKFAFHLGRYYMVKYFDYDMRYNKEFLVKNGMVI